MVVHAEHEPRQALPQGGGFQKQAVRFRGRHQRSVRFSLRQVCVSQTPAAALESRPRTAGAERRFDGKQGGDFPPRLRARGSLRRGPGRVDRSDVRSHGRSGDNVRVRQSASSLVKSTSLFLCVLGREVASECQQFRTALKFQRSSDYFENC